MIKSMTGFGRFEDTNDEYSLTVEMKSVNHRYLDIYLKLPRHISFMEEKIRSLISQKLSRGKVDIFITYDNIASDSKNVILNEGLAKAYYTAIKGIVNSMEIRDDLSASTLARFPDVLKIEEKEDQDKISSAISQAVEKAIDSLIAMRETEGRKLKESILDILDIICCNIENIKKRSPVVVKEYKQKLENRLNELLENQVIDESRLAVEVAYFADKSCIDEETVRLASHINQLRDILQMDIPVGRKLDFLVQEMNREVNTIGSKANDLEVTRYVVDLKSEIEKIREQVQNIE